MPFVGVRDRSLAGKRRGAWWVLFWALILSSLYLPSLATRFDFIDDGNLVYPSPPLPLGQRVQLAWDKVVGNYHDLGPFRPVLWAHWEIQAELLGAVAFRWRVARLLWLTVAAATLLWLFLELGIRPGAAVVTAALAMWTPYRNEIWTSLTLSEGVAMPYAILGLVCAIRAARSSRPGPWDMAGALCVLAALGCKNTFAALVPAQCFLRLAADGQPLPDAWRRHGRRACLLALTLLVPSVHYMIFKLQWHPGQYETGGPSWVQLGRMLRAMKRGSGADFVGPGLALAALALLVNGFALVGPPPPPGSHRTIPLPLAARAGFRPLWGRHRAALLTGLLLLVCGIGIYLPLHAVSGRYSMPAVWGADLWIAALLSMLPEVRSVFWRRAACLVLAGGLLGVAVANLGKQSKFAARAAMLWQALEFVEARAPRGACFGWLAGPDLNVEEGIHFLWHLHARGRRDVTISLLDAQGRPLSRREVAPTDSSPVLVLNGSASPPPGGSWRLVREFTAAYWAGHRRYHCYLWANPLQAQDGS